MMCELRRVAVHRKVGDAMRNECQSERLESLVMLSTVGGQRKRGPRGRGRASKAVDEMTRALEWLLLGPSSLHALLLFTPCSSSERVFMFPIRAFAPAGQCLVRAVKRETSQLLI